MRDSGILRPVDRARHRPYRSVATDHQIRIHRRPSAHEIVVVNRVAPRGWTGRGQRHPHALCTAIAV
jgi:hypothetical protein